jgi:hypothetical protein
MLSLAQAAKAAGKTKPTLVRWIQNGKLSAVRNDDGSYGIDLAELSRVCAVPGAMGIEMFQHGTPNGAGIGPVISAGEIEGLHRLLREREEVIRDLRQERDRAHEERRQVQARLDALLTDQRIGAAPVAAPAPGSLWTRFLRWRRGGP